MKGIKGLGSKVIEYLKSINYIDDRFTGKVRIEININQGGISDVKISSEIRIA